MALSRAASLRVIRSIHTIVWAFFVAAIAGGEWWRLLTGNLVHLGWWHLFLNEMGLLVLVQAYVWTSVIP